jgi:hypothetical protein
MGGRDEGRSWIAYAYVDSVTTVCVAEPVQTFCIEHLAKNVAKKIVGSALAGYIVDYTGTKLQSKS